MRTDASVHPHPAIPLPCQPLIDSDCGVLREYSVVAMHLTVRGSDLPYSEICTGASPCPMGIATSLYVQSLHSHYNRTFP
jgi:hypothetical protein